jgi:hypothetical protein
MSAVARRDFASASVRTRKLSSGRPMARAKITGVIRGADCRCELQRLAELPGPRLRDRIVEAITKSAAARRSSRAVTTSQGLRLSESEIAQKSPPSGAPAFAAAASMAVMPGSTRDLSSAPAGLAGFQRLEDRRRHGEDAGIAAGDDRDRLPSAASIQRMPGAVDLDAVVGGMLGLALARRHAAEIGAVADEVAGGIERRGCGRRQVARLAGAEADDGERAGHSRRPSPGTRIIEK